MKVQIQMCFWSKKEEPSMLIFQKKLILDKFLTACV